jgi:hypothetical protein
VNFNYAGLGSGVSQKTPKGLQVARAHRIEFTTALSWGARAPAEQYEPRGQEDEQGQLLNSAEGPQPYLVGDVRLPHTPEVHPAPHVIVFASKVRHCITD